MNVSVFNHNHKECFCFSLIIQYCTCTVQYYILATLCTLYMGSIRINERQQKKVSAEGADEALLADAAAVVAAKPALPPNKKLAYMLDLKTIVIRARALSMPCA